MDGLIFIIALGAIVAGFVQGLSGFAFSLVAMSFWAWTVEPRLAVVLAVFGGLCGQLIAAFSVRRGYDLKLLLPFIAGGLLGIPAGMLILPMLDVHLFKSILGALLILWCPVMLFGRHLPRITFGGRIADALAGMMGGICGGIGGFAGAIPTLWCALRGMDKDTQRNITQNFNLAILSVTTAAYAATGAVKADMLPMLALVGAAATIPAFFGARLYIGISEATFRTIVLTLLTAAGFALLSSSVPHLFSRL